MSKCEYSFELFNELTKEKRVIAFAASAFLQLIALNYADLNLKEKIDYIVDNDTSKNGTEFTICDSVKIVRTMDYLLADDLEDAVFLIGSDRYAYDIFAQLQSYDHLREVPCFALPLMLSKRKDDENFSLELQPGSADDGIPKIIHCFWLGDAPLDDMAQKCLESFKKYCPDYEIKLWTARNYDVEKSKYMYAAYQKRKWAYACDYARLERLYHEGGIYFDLDVELFANIDCLLANDFFAGFGPIRDIELAAFGSKKGNKLIGEMLAAYDDREFDISHEPGLLDVQPVYMDRFLEKKGFLINGKYQKHDGCALYPREIFSARNWFTGELELTDISLGVHHCAGSWLTKEDKKSNINRGELLKKLEGDF